MTRITQGRLKELLHYDPTTGIFTWRVNKSQGTKKGSKAGTINTGGYLQVRIDYTAHSAHRLAWLYMTGAWPKNDIDHIDLCKTNNSWGNLREATRQQNKLNTPLTSRNTSGFKGVHFEASSKKWVARIRANGQHLRLGAFDEPGKAYAVYCEAAVKYHGEFARLA